MRTITSFGDRTSGTFLIIALVSPTKITRSHGPITCECECFQQCYISSCTLLPLGFALFFNNASRSHQIFTVYKRSIFQVEWLIATLIFSFCCSDWPSTGLPCSYKTSKKASTRRANLTAEKPCVPGGGGGGYSQKNWVGVCGPLSKTLTCLRPKSAIFPTLTK